MVGESVPSINTLDVKTEMLPRVNEFRRFIRVFFSRKVVIFGFVIILLLLITAIFAPYLAPYDPYEQDLNHVLQAPSLSHLLGTDSIGRDTFSRIIFGSRITIMIGVVTVAVSASIGTVIGLIAGYFGKWTHNIIMRLTDAIMSIPPLLLAMVIAAMLGSGLQGVMIAVTFALVPGYIRLICGQVLSVKENEYVMAALSIGVSKRRIMFRHILPNCVSPLIVQMTIMMGVAILTEASLSFLGIGLKPPAAAWGSMVYDGYKYLITNPVLALAPGLAIMLIVFAFNMVGDGLRDTLDPRLRGSV